MREIRYMTPLEIRDVGWEALKSKLGVLGALQFLLQYDRGEGDYTVLRREVFAKQGVAELVEEMKGDKGTEQ